MGSCRLRARRHTTRIALHAACGLVRTAHHAQYCVPLAGSSALHETRPSTSGWRDCPRGLACGRATAPAPVGTCRIRTHAMGARIHAGRAHVRDLLRRIPARLLHCVLSIRGREVGRENLRGSNRVRAHLVSAGTRLYKFQVVSVRTRLTCSAPGPPNQLRIINSGTECLTVLRAH